MIETADAVVIGSRQGDVPLAIDLAKEGRRVVSFDFPSIMERV